MHSTYIQGIKDENRLDLGFDRGIHSYMGSSSSNEDNKLGQTSRLRIPKFESLLKKDFGTASVSDRRDATVLKGKYKKNLVKMSSRSANEVEPKRSLSSKKNQSRLDIASARDTDKKRSDSTARKPKLHSAPEYLDLSSAVSTMPSSACSPMSKNSRGTSSWKNSKEHGFESDEEDVKNFKM